MISFFFLFSKINKNRRKLMQTPENRFQELTAARKSSGAHFRDKCLTNVSASWLSPECVRKMWSLMTWWFSGGGTKNYKNYYITLTKIKFWEKKIRHKKKAAENRFSAFIFGKLGSKKKFRWKCSTFSTKFSNYFSFFFTFFVGCKRWVFEPRFFFVWDWCRFFFCCRRSIFLLEIFLFRVVGRKMKQQKNMWKI